MRHFGVFFLLTFNLLNCGIRQRSFVSIIEMVKLSQPWLKVNESFIVFVSFAIECFRVMPLLLLLLLL